MPRVVQVVVTNNFAGAERYVGTLSRSLQPLGWDVTVVGGAEAQMRSECGPNVSWLPGRTLTEAAKSMSSAGRFDICHVHMTNAEAVGIVTKPIHRAPIVATRHFARRRGSSLPSRVLAIGIRRVLAAEIAISQFVADALEVPPTVVLRNGVGRRPYRWQSESRTVLVMQRLEAEKATALALDAWKLSGLAAQGWTMRIAGDGWQRTALEAKVQAEEISGLEFVGWATDIDSEFGRAGMLLATAPAEPMGLTVVESMAAGVPVVAAASGGHLETIAKVHEAPLFPSGLAAEAAAVMRRLAADDSLRETLSRDGVAMQIQAFDIARHAHDIADLYAQVRPISGNVRHLV